MIARRPAMAAEGVPANPARMVIQTAVRQDDRSAAAATARRPAKTHAAMPSRGRTDARP